jgi:hypothetical protein
VKRQQGAEAAVPADQLTTIASELDTVKALLRGILEGDAGASVLARLDRGQGTATGDGKAWLAARAYLAKDGSCLKPNTSF